MAIIPIHKAITREALSAFGFVPKAIEKAEKANAAVDEKQGDDASETNLHAMRGYFPAPDPVFGALKTAAAPPPPLTGTLNTSHTNGNGNGPLGTGTASSSTTGLQLGRLKLTPDPLASMGTQYRLQTEDEVKEAVKVLLKRAHDDVVKAILDRKYDQAITRLGEALHTIQDRVFHHFEPWPYKDIADSVLNAPNYMMCHVLRDMGSISKIGVSEQQFSLGLATRADPDTYLGVEAFGPIGDQRSMTQGFRGWGGMVTITFGAAPGSRRVPDSTPDRDPRSTQDVIQSCLPTEGVADKAKATDDSEDFIAEVKKEVERKERGFQLWTDFTQMKSNQ